MLAGFAVGKAQGTGWLEMVETQLTLVPGECTIQEELGTYRACTRKKSCSVQMPLWSALFRGSWGTVQRMKTQEPMLGGGIEEHSWKG